MQQSRPLPPEGRDQVSAETGETRALSRRTFLKFSGITLIGLSAMAPLLARGAEYPALILDNAKGLLVGNPTRCVSCRRCELACTEFNDGKAWPSLSRIKVSRNQAYGPRGLQLGERGRGNWGDGLIIQDTCKQ
ncbi:MAG: 4Fe-4S ferredoxin, partial [Pseudomonadota bacterium]